MLTLGINAAYHDSAAAIVRDGEVVAAAEEERFTGIKHAKRPVPFSTWELPFNAIDYCLAAAGVAMHEVDHVAYGYDPYLLLGEQRVDQISLPLEPSAHAVPKGLESPWDPLFLASLVNAPRQLRDGAPHHLAARFRGSPPPLPSPLEGEGDEAPSPRPSPTKEEGDRWPRWHYVEHHLAHAASAFLPSPFESAAVMTLDGRGERATTTYSRWQGADFERIGQVEMPHSLGLLYERVTEHLGFLHSSDEYKVMALASYGAPKYLDAFRAAVRLGNDGCYLAPPVDLEAAVGPPRLRGEPFEQRHFDVARSLQQVLEETVLALAGWLHERTGERDLCLAGGVALNCVLNGRLRDEGPFERIWVQPASGDAGTALGAALWTDALERGDSSRSYRMEHAFLGPEYPDAEVEDLLHWTKTRFRRLGDVAGETADLLAAGQMVGWFQGRMEFGPRALGARSILASPIDPATKDRLNEIKDREDFRPVAPVVLEEEASRWFRPGIASPFMLFVDDVRPEVADRIPAVRHVDGTARIQTVRRDQHERYYGLLRAFAARTGVPVLVNTSFNIRGRPVVCTPKQALEAFWTSPLDALVIGPFLVEKPVEGPAPR